MHFDRWYWKLFGTAEKKRVVFKACTLVVFKKILNCSHFFYENNDGNVCIVTVFETIWKCKKNENRDGKWCILTVFETIYWNWREKFKTMAINGALCRYLIRYFDQQRKN